MKQVYSHNLDEGAMYRFFGLFLIASIWLLGCASVSSSNKEEGNDPQVYFAEIEGIEETAVFKKILVEEPGTKAYEKACINYLIERGSKSPYQFVRNGESYKIKRAMRHLKWKYWKYGKKAETVEDFINIAGTRSLKTGQLYSFKKSANELYPLRKVWFDELALLNTILLRYQESPEKEDDIINKEAGGKDLKKESIEEKVEGKK